MFGATRSSDIQEIVSAWDDLNLKNDDGENKPTLLDKLKAKKNDLHRMITSMHIRDVTYVIENTVRALPIKSEYKDNISGTLSTITTGYSIYNQYFKRKVVKKQVKGEYEHITEYLEDGGWDSFSTDVEYSKLEQLFSTDKHFTYEKTLDSKFQEYTEGLSESKVLYKFYNFACEWDGCTKFVMKVTENALGCRVVFFVHHAHYMHNLKPVIQAAFFIGIDLAKQVIYYDGNNRRLVDKKLGIEPDIDISTEIIKSINAKQRRGILIVGPAGTGKTSAINHVCNKIKDIPILFLNSTVRDPSVVKKVSKAVGALKRAVIIIEDIDSMGLDKKSTEANRLLPVLDGSAFDGDVVVIATANYANSMEQSIIRSGRIHSVYFVDRPKTIKQVDDIISNVDKELKVGLALKLKMLLYKMTQADISDILTTSKLLDLTVNEAFKRKMESIKSVKRSR